jgi:hypothetical protein
MIPDPAASRSRQVPMLAVRNVPAFSKKMTSAEPHSTRAGARLTTEIISTKRSAHHAFVEWIVQNTPRPHIVFNNVQPTIPPRLRQLSMSSSAIAPDAASEFHLLLSGEDDAILNFEGHLPENIELWNANYLRPRLSGQLRRVVFLRDPINMFASLARRSAGTSHGTFVLHRQVLGFEAIVRRLCEQREGLADHVVVMSEWMESEMARSALARKLGLATACLPKKVTAFGGGSSFEGQAFDPERQRASLFSRWTQVADDPVFLSCFTDSETLSAMRLYFQRFGHREIVSVAVVEKLAERARTRPESSRLARSSLAPMRSSLASLHRMERTPGSAERELRRAMIRLRMALRR